MSAIFNRIIARFSVIVLAVCIGSTALVAQVTSGTIFGSVKDSSGAVIPNATITVRAGAIGLTRTTKSSPSGEFVVPNLPPATYAIAVEAAGFKKLESQGIVLSAADKLNAGDLVLQVGTTTETVAVNADAGQIQLQSNSGERSDLITGKQLNDVAINGRNVLDYMKLIPGVISSFDGHASGTGGLDSININGTRANEHEFTIDGASNVDTGNNGATHVTINPDAIEEVKVLTSNYQAEFGKAAGGQIAITTKGGTNQFHGDARFFHRNEGLNANEWFNKQNELKGNNPNTPPLYRYNYIGYQVGGPIKKDKLFFFWSEEFYRQLIPISGTVQFYTPTKLEREGDFSQSVVPGKGNNPIPVQISGPGISNNVIDPAAINSQLQAILNLFPLPNVGGFGTNGQNFNFSESLSAHDPRREDILRVDFQLNSKNRLYGRWIHNTDDNTSPFVPFPGPFGIFACSTAITFQGGCVQHHPGWNLSLNVVSTITPNVLNEFSVGPSHTLSQAEAVKGNVSRGANNITLPLLFPVGQDQSVPDLGFSFNGASVNLPGSYLGATPWHQANTTINVNDGVTWVRRSHTMKFGLFYQRNRKDQIAWGNINGQFSFSSAPTGGGSCPGGAGTCNLGDPFASALMGNFDGFSQSTARPLGEFRYNQLEFYAQDTWKVTSRLTLDYGMRFSWIPPQYDAKNQVALFDPFSYNPANAVTIDSGGNIIPADGGNPLNGEKFASQHQIPAGGWDDRGIMPEPRFGFAYDVFSSHKTILRGGAGMMHDRVQGNLIFNTVFNNPAVVQTASVGAGNVTSLPTQQSSFGNGVLGNILGADRRGQVPTVYSFSFGVQQELARGTTLDIAYVGTMGRHLVTSRDINAEPYGTLFSAAAQDPKCSLWNGGPIPAVQPGLQPQYAAAGYNYNGWCALGTAAFTSAPLVPFKGYGQIPYLEFNGTSNYNSLQVSFQRRFSKGFTFGAVYTWSKVLTTANTDQDTQDPFNALLDYRRAGWDRTHVFAANYVYDIPSLTKHFGGPKWLSYITDNFQLSGVTQFETGAPTDLQNFFAFPPGSITGSDQYGATPYYYNVDSSGNPLIPRIGPPGRGMRDFFHNGGMQNWDLSLFKNIPLGSNEQRYIQLRLEGFNAFNHPNFQDKNYGANWGGPWAYANPTDPLTVTKNSNWGTYSDTYSGVGGFRVVQLGAKIYF
jgi:hypothetical protein